MPSVSDPLNVDAAKLDLQLREQRRTVDFDTFDISLQELIRMAGDGEIFIAPAYQRKFRWDDARCSQLIESLLLGIPVPSLMMATNEDATWEVVDGLQRLNAIIKFVGDGDLRDRMKFKDRRPLRLLDLQKLPAFDGLLFADLPSHIQRHLKTRPLKVVVLNDKSDKVVRYDLFERLNTGGVALTAQEIRDCVYQGAFAQKLEELSKDPNFTAVLKLTDTQQKDGTAEECVLRFFAYLHRYKEFVHSVTGFLNEYMRDATEKENHFVDEKIFKRTFGALAQVFPGGLRRSDRKGTTSLIHFEGVAVGAALALKKATTLSTKGLKEWLNTAELRGFTTGATNSPAAVKGRIEFCRDRFLGKPYVEPTQK